MLYVGRIGNKSSYICLIILRSQEYFSALASSGVVHQIFGVIARILSPDLEPPVVRRRRTIRETTFTFFSSLEQSIGVQLGGSLLNIARGCDGNRGSQCESQDGQLLD